MIAGFIGLAFGVCAAVFLLVGLLPLLGWVNWITSLPLAAFGLIFSRVSSRSDSILGIAGTVLNGIILIVALLRLFLGGGIV